MVRRRLVLPRNVRTAVFRHSGRCAAAIRNLLFRVSRGADFLAPQSAVIRDRFPRWVPRLARFRNDERFFFSGDFMKPARSNFRRLILIALICIAPIAGAATDPSFLLTATAKNFESYFPGELANGYLSTFTSPRGTESNLSYLVAFMDHGKNDIARPAAIPGRSGIDYRADSTGAWLNLAPLEPSVFQDYRQVLDLHDATLTTRYRYVDHGKATRVEAVAFVSEASPHLAAVRFTITPEFDGMVELSFPLVL